MGKLILIVFIQCGLALGQSISEIQEILTRGTCLRCHGANSSSGDFASLTTNAGWATSPYVIPNSPDKSLLISRLRNNGGNMPRDASKTLSSSDHQKLRSWVTGLSPVVTSTPSPSPSGPPLPAGAETSGPTGKWAQMKVYQKCVSHFKNDVILPNDPVLISIKAQKSSGVQSCMNLLNRVPSDLSREVKSPDAKAILKTMHEMHASWTPYNINFLEGSNRDAFFMVFEADSEALALTKILFEDLPVKSLFEMPTQLRGIREQGNGDLLLRDLPRNEKLGSDVDLSASTQLGNLVGITSNHTIRTTLKDRDGVTTQVIDLEKSLGGGVLGFQDYLFRYSGGYLSRPSDGGIQVARTLVKNVIEHFFCRELPILRPGDEIADMDPEGDSELEFKNGRSCMGCHSTMDPAAHAVRNLFSQGTPTSTIDGRINRGLRFIGRFNGTIQGGGEVWPDKDSSFYKTAPTGRLYYRNYRGELINRSISGISGLADAIKESDDFYACMSKRYFQYFTGIEVSLADLGSPLSTPLSSEEMDHRNFVIQLGAELKQHQSLKQLIESIFSNSAYLRPGHGLGKL